MVDTTAPSRLLDATSEEFATSLLPLYSSSHVTIRIGSTGPEYKLPKAILCKQSPYFAAMFEGHFKEREEQSAHLEEMDGVVTRRSFEMFVQWVCLGRVVFRKDAPEDSISAAIEFARLADMYRITGMESFMAEHIKAVILADLKSRGYGADRNTRCLTSSHIMSGVELPEGHPVRIILAEASVEACLRQEKYKFEEEALRAPGFSADLLQAVRKTIWSADTKYDIRTITIEEPISQARFPLRKP